MEKLEDGYYKIDYPGSLESTIIFSPEVCCCGQVFDGVHIGLGEDGRCGGVIPYEDLIEMAKLATEVRGTYTAERLADIRAGKIN